MTVTTASANLSTVKRIGVGVRLTESATADIIATLPDGFDPAARGAVTGAVIAWACGSGEVPAQKTGPKGSQKSTDFGRGVDALTKSVKRALSADADKPVTLRASLSGEGGGSTTIPADHPLYAAIVALITESGEE